MIRRLGMQSFSDAPAIKPMPIETDPTDPTDEPQQPDTQQPPDQPDHPMPAPRPPTPPDENMSDPPPDPPHQPDHPTTRCITRQSSRSTVAATRIRRLNGKNSPFHPQAVSIDWGVMPLCRHSRNHLNQFFRLSWYLRRLRF